MKQTLLTLVALVLLGSSINAQTWTSCNGPVGANITGMDTFKSFLWVSTREGGVYRSSNNGASWQAYSNGLGTGGMNTINTLISANGKLFIGIHSGMKVLVSATGTWTTVSVPSGVGILGFCKQGTALFANNAGGVIKSTDNGVTWTAANSGLPTGQYLQGLQSTASYLVASFAKPSDGSPEIYRSVNGGTSWSLATAPTSSSGTYLFGYLKTLGDKVFIGGDEISYTADGGLTWNIIPNSYGNYINDLIFTNGRYLGAGYLGYLVDYPVGSNPKYLHYAPPLSTYTVLSKRLYKFGNSIFIGTYADGLLKMDTTASLPQFANTGLNAAPIAFIDGKGGRVIAQAFESYGLHSSVNNGLSWTRDSLFGQSRNNINSSAHNGSLWYLGHFGTGIHLSQNNGLKWRRVNDGLPTYPTAPTYPAIGCMTATPGGLVFAGMDNVLYQAQRDTSWVVKYTFPGANPIVPLIELVADATNIYAGTGGNGSGSLYRSTDNGTTWKDIGTWPGPYHMANAIAIQGNRLIVSSPGLYIYSSLNAGTTWTKLDSGFTTSSGNGPGMMELKTIGGKVYGISLFEQDLYELSAGSNVWKNLTPLATDPQAFSVWGVDTVLYIGTTNNGVWKRKLTLTSIGWEQESNTLEANVFPNPATNQVTIERAKGATATLINSIGQQAMSFLVTDEKHTADISALPAGLYILQITDAKGTRGAMSILKQ